MTWGQQPFNPEDQAPMNRAKGPPTPGDLGIIPSSIGFRLALVPSGPAGSGPAEPE